MSASPNAARAAEIVNQYRRIGAAARAGLCHAITAALDEAEARGQLDMWQTADRLLMAHPGRTFRYRLQDIKPDTPSPAAQPAKGEM